MEHKVHFEEISTDALQEDEHQPRRNFGTHGDKNRLLLSLKAIGVQQPITVRHGTEKKFVIVDGHRRFRCARELGFGKVPCKIVSDATAAELEKIRFEIQNNRRPWKPLERATALARMKELTGLRTNKELAEHLFLSETLVSNSLKLLEQKEDYKELMDEFELPESYRTEFVRLQSKLRPIREFSADAIIRSVFGRVKHRVIQSSKEFRTLGRIFLRARANEDMLYAFLKDEDMRVEELERHTIQSGFSLWIEQVLQRTCDMAQKGIPFSAKELLYLRELRNLLNKVV